jgi:hypothetical protein
VGRGQIQHALVDVLAGDELNKLELLPLAAAIEEDKIID